MNPIHCMLISLSVLRYRSCPDRDSCPSLHSNCSSVTEDLHLALVFFDVLLLGYASYLNVPYASRRSLLESVVREIPGRSMIAERALISSGPEVSLERASQRLREVWAQRIVDCEEGLVLKAGESFYGDWKLPWVKACDNDDSWLHCHSCLCYS